MGRALARWLENPGCFVFPARIALGAVAQPFLMSPHFLFGHSQQSFGHRNRRLCFPCFPARNNQGPFASRASPRFDATLAPSDCCRGLVRFRDHPLYAPARGVRSRPRRRDRSAELRPLAIPTWRPDDPAAPPDGLAPVGRLTQLAVAAVGKGLYGSCQHVAYSDQGADP